MATVYGVNATKINSPSFQNILGPDQQGARVRWIHDSYECVATASGTDIILGGKIPANAHVLPGSALYHDDLGAANVTVGTTAAGAELAASTDVNNTTTIPLNNTVDLFGTKSTAAANVHVTPDAQLDGTIRLSIAYAMA